MVTLHRSTAEGIANIGFVGGTIVIAVGIYALLRGETTDGVVTISAGVSLTTAGIYNLIRLDAKDAKK